MAQNQDNQTGKKIIAKLAHPGLPCQKTKKPVRSRFMAPSRTSPRRYAEFPEPKLNPDKTPISVNKPKVRKHSHCEWRKHPGGYGTADFRQAAEDRRILMSHQQLIHPVILRGGSDADLWPLSPRLVS